MTELYPRLLEIFLYTSAIYLFCRKKELVLIYLPMLFFTRNLIELFFLRHIIWYALVSLFLVIAAYRSSVLKDVNLPAVLLFGYFTVLYILSGNMSETRSTYFAMVCLIAAFVIVPNLYRMRGRERIGKELHSMAACVIFLFIINTGFSSLMDYSPYELYGRDSGAVYGNMQPTTFMLIPLALAIYLMRDFRHIAIWKLIVALIALALLVLTFRRTVQFTAALAILAFLVVMIFRGDQKQVAITCFVSVLAIGSILSFTEFRTQFMNRYEMRFGDQDLVKEEEGRITDHKMVYRDVFVHGRYSMLFGHSFFNSAGNYGGGVQGERTLHPDIPVLMHASGLIGVGLYLAMVFKGFRQSWKESHDLADKTLWFFCLGTFLTFTFAGRITEESYAIGFVVLLLLPVAGPRTDEQAEEEIEEESLVEQPA